MNTETPVKLEPYQERVIAETKELDIKIERLKNFLESKELQLLKHDEIERLHSQLNAMRLYRYALGDRIAHFPKPEQKEP